MANATEKRKGSHIGIALRERVEPDSPAGFEEVRLLHNALPELDLSEVDTSVTILGKRLRAPFLIAATTGGFPEAEKINKDLAAAAEASGIAFGLGSQRAMIENPSLSKTYQVRDVAPKALIFGNIGMVQLKQYPLGKIDNALSKAGADALAVHLNPLQEAVQPEGDKSFSGCLKALERACEKLSVPVIAKETGSGISRETALKLQEAGVKMIDVAGLGGTSWSLVEGFRSSNIRGFDDWGIPSAACIAEVSREVVVPVIGSGGVRSGLDAAKCISLGAMLSGASLPFLKAWGEGGRKSVESLLRDWTLQLKTAMLLTGSRDLESLKKARLLISGKTAELLLARGIDPREYSSR